MKILSGLTLILASCIFSTQALEPLEDRAVVQRMNTDLLLPDGSTLNVDVSFDCGSDYHNTAVMIMSDSGAMLLAAAYTHLYGEKYGQQVIDAWNTKKNKDDPRKPTYLFAIAPREKEFAWRNKPNQNIHNNLTYDTLGKYISDRQLANKTESFEDAQFIPVLAAGCGTKIHNPQVAQ
ncbi:hypothetical protein [Pseudoalteromonas sp. McH1-7]|uniref:hypothetical protein n=1 Tax=Pseudoalteromonas sp. McH1-7 TaxID=2745574 RepID=UPI001C378981|nr:hypothetical protein [Pseudoalteromonas sp. McH1-7]